MTTIKFWSDKAKLYFSKSLNRQGCESKQSGHSESQVDKTDLGTLFTLIGPLFWNHKKFLEKGEGWQGKTSSIP